MDLFDKHGGYRKLDSFTLATVIQLGTFRFCEVFLNRKNDPCGRQFDQMTQSARSGRANITEGSERSGTSKETEIKLTDVSRASLGELKGDYEFWLLHRKILPWPSASREARAVYDVRLDENPFCSGAAVDMHDAGVYLLAQYEKFAPWLESEEAERVANALLILISRTLQMLDRQMLAQGKKFKEEGGFRERMSAVRLEQREKQQADPDAPACPECGKTMRKRLAKAGKNAGKAFWGCPGFPGCKGTREVET